MEKSPKLLVAEDDAAVRELLDAVLDMLHLERDAAWDGKEAIRLLGERRYTLLLTDLNMPERNGLEVAKFARERHPELPIVMMSGSWTAEDRAQAGTLPGIVLVDKPFSVRALIARLSEILRLGSPLGPSGGPGPQAPSGGSGGTPASPSIPPPPNAAP